jgi:hypothetical protein
MGSPLSSEVEEQGLGGSLFFLWALVKGMKKAGSFEKGPASSE